MQILEKGPSLYFVRRMVIYLCIKNSSEKYDYINRIKNNTFNHFPCIIFFCIDLSLSSFYFYDIKFLLKIQLCFTHPAHVSL